MGLTSFTYQIKLKIKQMLCRHYKMETILKQIVNNTEPKRSSSVVECDNKIRFKTWFKPRIQLNKKKDCEIALINLETYYSFPNIYRSNKCFSYSPDANASWIYIFIPDGNNRVEYINDSIQREIRKNSHYRKANDKDYFEISANTNTLKYEMILNNN